MTDRYGHPRQSAFGRRHASAAASVQYSSISSANHPPPVHPPAATASSSRRSNNNVNSNKLFGGQLTRRPQPVVGGGDDSAAVFGGDDGEHEDEGRDIVVRGVNGEVEVDEPPCLVVDDLEEIVLDLRQENAKERQRLADAVKQHQSQQSSVPAQPEELLEAVRASLRAKVAALAEDTWMYEKEEEPHVA